MHVIRLDDGVRSARVDERRQHEVNDVGKRAAYRRAHGLPMEYSLFGKVLGKSKVEEVIEEVVEEVDEVVEGVMGEGKTVAGAVAEVVEEKEGEGKKKKWLGIW